MKRENNHSVDVVFALALFCIFAASILMVLMTGAGAYKGIASVLEKQYQERVCLSYIAAKVRHFDTENSVSVGEFAGGDALFLDEKIDGGEYRTTIYFYDGKVMELFCEKNEKLEPEAGAEIIDAEAISFESLSSGLLRVKCTGAGGRTDELVIGLRSGGETA